MSNINEQDLVAGVFEVKQLVARGGFGSVFKVQHKHSGKLFALKAAGGAQYMERLKREAAQAQGLDHPNIMKVHGLVVDEEVGSFLLMEWIEGNTLADFVGTCSLEDTLQILEGVCAGLEVAHAHGLIHRDVTPGNLMLNAKGKIQIIDWGLAKAPETSQNKAITTEGYVVGTPGYLAPELIGLGVSPTPASDVYSLAALVYALISGGHPFSEHPLESRLGLRVSARLTPNRLSERTLEKIPVPLDELLLNALSRDPKERPQSAQGFFLAYQAAIVPEQPMAPKAPSPPPEPTGPSTGIVLAALGFLALVGALVAIYGPFNASQAPTIAPTTKLNPQEPEELTPTPDANTASLAVNQVETARQDAEIKATMGAAKKPARTPKKAKPSAKKVEVHLMAVPWGDITIKGKRCKDECSVLLPPGKHTVKAQLRDLQIVRTITVSPDKTIFNFDFSSKL